MTNYNERLDEIFANRPKAMSPQALIEFLVREDKEEFVGLVMAMEGHIARLTGELSVYRELTLRKDEKG
jgi:hypothetical protein